jgi:hypothetical protein
MININFDGLSLIGIGIGIGIGRLADWQALGLGGGCGVVSWRSGFHFQLAHCHALCSIISIYSYHINFENLV